MWSGGAPRARPMVTRCCAWRPVVCGRVECPFCAIASGAAPAAMVLDTPDVLAFLDRRPVFKGHTLLIPRRHRSTLAELDGALVATLFARVQEVAAAVRAGMGAGGRSWR